MKNSKEKGNRYEREIARKLSVWISEGRNRNLLWRSDSSGARATTSKEKLSNQAGDIAPDSKEGYDFIDKFYVECKHYKNIGLENLIWRSNKQENVLTWWRRYTKEADKYNKILLLICKQNNKPDLLFVTKQFIDLFEIDNEDITLRMSNMYVMFLNELVRKYDYCRCELT